MHPEHSSGRETRMQQWTLSGLRAVPHLAWGGHLAHIFASGDELRDVMVPFFKAGLDNNERCFWLTGKAFNADDARAALRVAVPDLDKRERDKQIEIANGDAWYASGTMPRPQDLIDRLLERGEDALTDGYAGLRTSGNCAWVAKEQWADFVEYERLVHAFTRGRPMICMCSYCVDQIGDNADLDVMSNHDMVIPVRRSAGTLRNDIREAQPTPSPSSLIATIAGVAQDVLDALPIGILRLRCRRPDRPRQPQGHRAVGPRAAPARPDAAFLRLVPASKASTAVISAGCRRRWRARCSTGKASRASRPWFRTPTANAGSRGSTSSRCATPTAACRRHQLLPGCHARARHAPRHWKRQQRTFDLAMIASQMGTWRYTLADNICVYDDNAQRLYGLTEARFLHDEEGVKAKFHPDDMELMWARVAKALDPQATAATTSNTG